MLRRTGRKPVCGVITWVYDTCSAWEGVLHSSNVETHGNCSKYSLR
jgi:hypothetical protein